MCYTFPTLRFPEFTKKKCPGPSLFHPEASVKLAKSSSKAMAPKIPQVNSSLFGGAGEVGTSGAAVAGVTLAGKKQQKKSPVAETYKVSNNPGTGTPPPPSQ